MTLFQYVNIKKTSVKTENIANFRTENALFFKKNISLIHHQKKLGGGFWKSFLLDLIIFL